MPQVTLVRDSLQLWAREIHDVDNVIEFLMREFPRWPRSARIYRNVVSEKQDVTPSDKNSVDLLLSIDDPLIVVVYPGEVTTTTMLIMASIVALGLLAVSSFKRPPQPTIRQRHQASSTNTLGSRVNDPRPLARIPDSFGRQRIVPDLLSVPWRFYVNDREHEICYMCIGRGSYLIDEDEVWDGDTKIKDISGSVVKIYPPDSSPLNGNISQTIGAQEFEVVSSETTTLQSDAIRLNRESSLGHVFGSDLSGNLYSVYRNNTVNGQLLLPSNVYSFDCQGCARFSILTDHNEGTIEVDDSDLDFTTVLHSDFAIEVSAFRVTGASSYDETLGSKVFVISEDNTKFLLFSHGVRSGERLTSDAVGKCLVISGGDLASWRPVSSEIWNGRDVHDSIFWTIKNGESVSGAYKVVSVATVEVEYRKRPAVRDLGGYSTREMVKVGLTWLAGSDFWNDEVMTDFDDESDYIWSYMYQGNRRRRSIGDVPQTRMYASEALNVKLFDFSDFVGLGIDGTYEINSFSEKSLKLHVESRLHGAWESAQRSTAPDTQRAMLYAKVPEEKWIGPIYVDKSAVSMNFLARNGLYVETSTGNPKPFPVQVVAKISKLDDSGNKIVGGESVKTLDIKGSGLNREGKAATLAFDLPDNLSGRYRIDVRRATETDLNARCIDSLRLTEFFELERVPDHHLFGNVTTAMVETIATKDATSIKERKFNLLATRKVVTYREDGTRKGLVATRNAGDIFIAACLDDNIGRKLQEDVDISGIKSEVAKAIAALGSDEKVEFNGTFDNLDISVEETLSTVAAAAFLVPYRWAKQIKVRYEGSTAKNVLVLNHRTKVDKTETRSLSFGIKDNHNGVIYEYTDRDSGLPESIYLPNSVEPSNPIRVEEIGVQNRSQAEAHAKRIWNKEKYQNVVVTVKATQEAEILSLGDCVILADNTHAVDNDGEVVSQTDLVLELSQRVPRFAQGVSYKILVQLPSGSVQERGITRVSDRSVRLASGLSESLALGVDNYARATYKIFKETDVGNSRFIVVEKTPTDDMTYDLKLVNYDSRVYA